MVRLILIALVAVLSFTRMAMSQPPPPPPPPKYPITQGAAPQPPQFTLTVSPDDINVISEGLMTQPFGKVAPVIQKLREQILAQQSKDAPALPAEGAVPK